MNTAMKHGGSRSTSLSCRTCCVANRVARSGADQPALLMIRRRSSTCPANFRPETVETHSASIRRKTDPTALVRKALRHDEPDSLRIDCSLH